MISTGTGFSGLTLWRDSAGEPLPALACRVQRVLSLRVFREAPEQSLMGRVNAWRQAAEWSALRPAEVERSVRMPVEADRSAHPAVEAEV